MAGMQMSVASLIGAADYIGSSLDLGNATHEELTDMLLTAMMQGYGMETQE